MMLSPEIADYAGRALLGALALWFIGFGAYKLWSETRHWRR